NASLRTPRAVTLDVTASPDSDREVLMPGDPPVSRMRLVEQESTNRKASRAQSSDGHAAHRGITGQRADRGNLFKEAPGTAPATCANSACQRPDGRSNGAHLDRAQSFRYDDEPLFVDLTCRQRRHRTETPGPPFVRPRTRKCISTMSAFAAA